MKVSFTKKFCLDVGKCPLLGLKKRNNNSLLFRVVQYCQNDISGKMQLSTTQLSARTSCEKYFSTRIMSLSTVMDMIGSIPLKQTFLPLKINNMYNEKWGFKCFMPCKDLIYLYFRFTFDPGFDLDLIYLAVQRSLYLTQSCFDFC